MSPPDDDPKAAPSVGREPPIDDSDAALAVGTEPPDDDSGDAIAVGTQPAGDDPDAALIGDERLYVLAVGVDPDAALTDDEEESPAANFGDGAKPAPQSGCEVESVSTRKNHGLQPGVSDGAPNWLSESNED